MQDFIPAAEASNLCIVNRENRRAKSYERVHSKWLDEVNKAISNGAVEVRIEHDSLTGGLVTPTMDQWAFEEEAIQRVCEHLHDLGYHVIKPDGRTKYYTIRWKD